MYRPRVIPVLLLKNKGLVKTIGFNTTTYIGDPINAVKIFNEKEADELIFLDIQATKENRSIDLKTVKEIADEAYMPFAVGGGIKDLETAKKLIQYGAEKIIINSAFNEQPDLVSDIAKEIGNQSVVVSIDAKKNWLGKWQAYTCSGTKNTGKHPLVLAKQAEEKGAGEVFLNCINLDGHMKGYAINLIEEISSAITIPLVVCGGAGKLTDFNQAIKHGAHAVAAGSLFVYHGAMKGVLINYPDKLELMKTFEASE